MNVVLLGFLASLAAGSMTAVGALPVLLGRRVSEQAADAFLGFAAGVMLSASFFSLILPGLDAATPSYGETGGAFVAAAGVALGAGIVALMNHSIPHQHFKGGREGVGSAQLAKIWLFVIAITIHNFPEGLAVGVGFGGGNVENGLPLAIGIGLQNAPEGLAVAIALLANGYSRRMSVLTAAATGMVEPIGGALGVLAVSVSEALLPWGLTFAAGAMLYIISHEIIPETHARGNQNVATTGFLSGLILMMLLDVIFG